MRQRHLILPTFRLFKSTNLWKYGEVLVVCDSSHIHVFGIGNQEVSFPSNHLVDAFNSVVDQLLRLQKWFFGLFKENAHRSRATTHFKSAIFDCWFSASSLQASWTICGTHILSKQEWDVRLPFLYSTLWLRRKLTFRFNSQGCITRNKYEDHQKCQLHPKHAESQIMGNWTQEHKKQRTFHICHPA